MTDRIHRHLLILAVILSTFTLGVFLAVLRWSSNIYIRLNWPDDTYESIYKVMPLPTKLALSYWYLPIVFIILTGLVAIVYSCLATVTKGNLGLMYATWLQGASVWFALFGYFYIWFHGLMKLGDPPRFSFESFLGTHFGFFPVTLCLMLVILYKLIRFTMIVNTESHNKPGLEQSALPPTSP